MQAWLQARGGQDWLPTGWAQAATLTIIGAVLMRPPPVRAVRVDGVGGRAGGRGLTFTITGGAPALVPTSEAPLPASYVQLVGNGRGIWVVLAL